MDNAFGQRETVLLIVTVSILILLVLAAYYWFNRKLFKCGGTGLKEKNVTRHTFTAPKSRSYYDQFLSKDEVEHFKKKDAEKKKEDGDEADETKNEPYMHMKESLSTSHINRLKDLNPDIVHALFNNSKE